jgi:hypothetical protein
LAICEESNGWFRVWLELGCSMAFLHYVGKNETGKIFALDVVLLMIRFAIMIVGIIFLFLRLLKLFKTFPLYYIFTAALNFVIGIFALVLFVFDNADVRWFHLFIPNILIGVIMLFDIYVLD